MLYIMIIKYLFIKNNLINNIFELIYIYYIYL